jgi:hypothetical protein
MIVGSPTRVRNESGAIAKLDSGKIESHVNGVMHDAAECRLNVR